MVRSLVTGGCGFIGSHLVDALIDLNHDVVVIDNKSANNEKFYFNSKANYFNLDICNYKKTKKLYNNIDYVFHLAAESRLQPAILDPINAMQKNVIGTTVVLQCAREAKVKRVIYSSTSSCYGNNPYPNVETQLDDCLNPYSVSKNAGEKICKLYNDLFGLETITLRYFNVYGERSPTVGQYAPVIGIFQKQKQLGQPLTIVGDGSQRRDFVDVFDVVNANLLVATSNLDKKYFGQIYNVGSGKNISVLEIAKMISNDITFIPPREAEMHTTLANIDKIKKVFGFEPIYQVTDYLKND